VVTARLGDIKCWLLAQVRIRPAFEDAAFYVDGQVSPLCIQNRLDILSFHSFADLERLAEQMQVALRRDLANECDSPNRDGQGFCGNRVAGWQFLKFALAAVFLGSQAAQSSLRVLCIDGILQALQFTFESADASKMMLE
jgi:hypothetical protein